MRAPCPATPAANLVLGNKVVEAGSLDDAGQDECAAAAGRLEEAVAGGEDGEARADGLAQHCGSEECVAGERFEMEDISGRCFGIGEEDGEGSEAGGEVYRHIYGRRRRCGQGGERWYVAALPSRDDRTERYGK